MLLSCSPKEADRTPIFSESLDNRYIEISTRSMLMSENDWIVSRDSGNNVISEGDSLIWSGVFWGSMPCDFESPLLYAFADGSLYRFPTLKDKISMDGVLGFYFAIAANIARCGATEKLQSAFRPHYEFTLKNRGKLNEHASERLELEFTYLRDLIAYHLGLRGSMPTNRDEFETMLVLWTHAVMVKRAACYRIHLSWLALHSAELLGGMTKKAKNDFCFASDGSDLPVIDHWCKRGNLQQWLEQFTLNIWEYRHQRCPAWENPDAHGYERPGLDFLIGYRELKE